MKKNPVGVWWLQRSLCHLLGFVPLLRGTFLTCSRAMSGGTAQPCQLQHLTCWSFWWAARAEQRAAPAAEGHWPSSQLGRANPNLLPLSLPSNWNCKKQRSWPSWCSSCRLLEKPSVSFRPCFVSLFVSLSSSTESMKLSWLSLVFPVTTWPVRF